MTVLFAPGRLLTITDYEALPEDEVQRWELLEGNLVMGLSPTPAHNLAIGNLYRVLAGQVPPEFVLIPDVDLDLELAPAAAPATVRRPDLVVVTRDEFDRVNNAGGLLHAGGAVLVAEIMSLGSRRTDRLIKRGEYADAGIPHYWIIDPDNPISLVACQLGGTSGYQDGGEVTGLFESSAPFPVRIELTALE